MVTIRDVARHAGVSVATVSRVINNADCVSDKMCRRVQASIQALGFEPDFLARSWRTRSARTVAAVVSDNTSPHHGLLLREAATVALAHDYSLLLCTTYFDPEIERRYLKMLRFRRVDGILLNTVGNCEEEIRELTASGVPVVLLNRPLEQHGPLVDAVVVDSYRGSFDLVEHLIRVGHQRIVFVYARLLNDFHRRERLRGYRDALLAHDLPCDENLICAQDLASEDNTALCTRLLTSSPRPTALYAAGYSTGLAAMKLLRSLGLRIPQDMAFAMFDDVAWGAFVDPPLTLVRNPVEEMGQLAMDLLLSRLANRERPPREIRLQPTLIVRRSCGWPGLTDR